MKKFNRKIELLDAKRVKIERKAQKISTKLTAKVNLIKAQTVAKQTKMLEKFASKNGVSYEVVLERYNELQREKEQAVLDKKITKKLVK